MARQPYNESESLQNMTTRQLRQYIADKATEAQARIDSMNMEKAPASVQDQARYITDKSGSKVKRSTSYMSKAEMVEYAFDLREFNMLDTTSKYSRDIEWTENKSRYETFIRNTQIVDFDASYSKEFAEYWKKYINKDGSISKRGYAEYKRYVELTRAISGNKEQFGYREFKQYAVQMLDKRKRVRDVNKILDKVFIESSDKGDQDIQELVDKFNTAVNAYDERQAQKAIKKATAPKKTPKKTAKTGKIKTKGQSKKKSKTTIKTKTVGKMKTNATVRERID